MFARREKKAIAKPSTISTSSSGLPKWRQSPVDLCKAATWSQKFPPLYLTNYWSHEGTAMMTNTGRTVSIEFSDREPPLLRGGPLNKDEFQFMNVQFRWGPENSLGAEHSINGIWYSMEAQIMHWNTRYGSMEKCFDKPDGIIILSTLMQVIGCPGVPDNPSLTAITDNLSKIKKMGSSTKISPGLPTTGQSPINLDDNIVRKRRYTPLVLNGHWLNDGEARLCNTGITAKVSLGGNRIPSTICGGPLSDDVYEFSNVHFHWGEDNCKGAEHTINDTWYSMEGHAVHWNRKYITMEECFRHKDGLCCLAYLFLVQPACCDCINPQLERITEYLKHIPDPDMETKIPANCLSWMRWATYCTRYYTYAGSYNAGEYPECMTWIVFPVVIPIRPSELNEFRKLRDRSGQYIKSNWREIQLLKCRQIYLAVS
ncbi:PREDICTED: carbonic anhydrase 2-like [Eufriesea mexicana]|uniref:carbonic anhydrase 2-like n=1 Tax=Eufriesea mexicana TaxID=516756 RepID=UPI00083C8618|nr:PREDICTED: carbonic anhydrase 2-like [Eufriesea mexicana]